MIFASKRNSQSPIKSVAVDRPHSFGRMILNVFHNKKNVIASSEETPARFYTIGGVYHEADETDAKPHSNQSLHTEETQSSDDTSSCSVRSWSSSGASNHNKGAPRIAKTFSQRRINPNNSQLSEEELVGRIMLKSRSLPKHNGYYASNHVMINNERTKRFVAPLKRLPTMDELARMHAKEMAKENQLFHSDRDALHQDVVGQHIGCRIGENVTKGANIEVIHKFMMQSLADKNNILDRRFTCMGVGTAKADDGTLYLCQIFSD